MLKFVRGSGFIFCVLYACPCRVGPFFFLSSCVWKGIGFRDSDPQQRILLAVKKAAYIHVLLRTWYSSSVLKEMFFFSRVCLAPRVCLL